MKNVFTKLIIITLFVVVGASKIASANTWSATNLTSVSYLPITGMESHDNELYATVFNGFTAILYRLNPDNTSWSTITTESSITVPRFLKSAGSRLYMSTIVSGVTSLLYYTTDGCNTFNLDTVGLPHASGNISLIYGLQYFDGKIYANIGSFGYYVKDTSETAWRHIDVPTALHGGSDPITYINGTLFAYDNTGTHTMYFSTDFGDTWTVRTSNLPSDYETNQFIADQKTGRLYSFGVWDNNTKSGVYYSDDKGVNWTAAANANSFLGLNANHTLQLVTAMFAEGDIFYMALENNADSSALDVVGSTTGFEHLAYDTLGLPTDVVSAVKGANFLLHKGSLAIQMNVMDIYLKSGVSEVHEFKQQNQISVYPNPTSQILTIKVKNYQNQENYSITDYLGKTVLSGKLSGETTSIDIGFLLPGIYFIQSDKDRIESFKIIKE